jgi:hypothetical protein
MKRTSNNDHVPTETDFVVINEHDLVTVHTIQPHHVKAMWQRAEREGQSNISRLCFTATNDANAPDVRRHALMLLAEHWNDEIERRADLTIITPPNGTAAGTSTNFAATPDRAPAATTATDPTRSDPMVLLPVAFSCPFCHTSVVLVEHEGVLRLPYHRTGGIFPFSVAGPVYSAECPGWFAPVYPICIGAHDAPACDDPTCWHRTPATEPSEPEILPDPPLGPTPSISHPQGWEDAA